MTLLVTGANGFIGSAILRRAHAAGRPVRGLVRESSDLTLLQGLPPELLVRGAMDDAESLAEAVRGCSAVAHCAATTSSQAPDLERSRRVNVEGTRALLEACRQAGLTRFINISSQSAHPDNPSVYGRTKLEQDELVRASALEWTILRPSIVYGPAAKGIFDKMVGYCRRLPAVPVIGSGHEEMRPVHVEDLADAVLACLDTPATIGRSYDIGGAQVLEMNEFIAAIMRALGRRPRIAHLPVPLALLIARTLSALMQNPPLTPDNVTGISTVRHVDISAAEKDFGFAPRAFTDGLEACLAGSEQP